MHIGDNKLAITTEPKAFHFGLPKDSDNNLMHKIDYIIKHNDFLTWHTIRNEISRLLFKYKHGSNVHEHRK